MNKVEKLRAVSRLLMGAVGRVETGDPLDMAFALARCVDAAGILSTLVPTAPGARKSATLAGWRVVKSKLVRRAVATGALLLALATGAGATTVASEGRPEPEIPSWKSGWAISAEPRAWVAWLSSMEDIKPWSGYRRGYTRPELVYKRGAW